MQNTNVTWFWFIQFKILVPMAWLKKYGNPEVQIPTFFATANQNKTKYSEPWEQEKKNGSKSLNQNPQMWPTEPVELNFCQTRSTYSLTAGKNATVGCDMNFRIPTKV